MSGGSYDYLGVVFPDDLEELLSKQYALGEMVTRLAGLGYAEDAARETEDLILMIRQLRVRAAARVARLVGVWHAVEWWDSYDSDEAGVHKALAAYRDEGSGGPNA